MTTEEKALTAVDIRKLLVDKESDEKMLPFERNIIEIGRIISNKGQPDKSDPGKLTRRLRAGERDSISGSVDLTEQAFNANILILETDSRDPAVQIFSAFYVLNDDISVGFDLIRIP